MYDIVKAEQLAVGVLRYTFLARPISSKQNVGQFMLLRVDAYSEWIPLTVADTNPIEGTVTVVFQVNDRRTDRLSKLWEGDEVSDLQLAQSVMVTDRRTGARTIEFQPVGRLSRITRPPTGGVMIAGADLAPPEHEPGRRGGLMLPVLAFGFLLVAVAAVAYVISRFATPDAPDVIQRGAARIESSPPGAYINVDGVDYPQATPATIEGLILGASHYIKVSKPGHFAEVAEVLLTLNSPMKTVNVTLQQHRAAKGMIRVVTRPVGATLFIDGQRQPETTPCTIAGIGLDVPHRLRVERVGYSMITTEFQVTDAHELLRLPFTLEPVEDEPIGASEDDATAAPRHSGAVTITASLPCDVLIDGTRVGTTPLPQTPLDEGNYELKLANRQEHLERTYRLAIEAGDTVVEHFEFRKGTVTFTALPATEIYLGERMIGQVPMAPLSLYEGDYVFRAVDRQLGQELRIEATIIPDTDNTVDIDFNRPESETEEP